MHIALNFISGFMLGFEIVSSNDLEGWEEDITFVVLDLFIVRFTFSF